MSSSLHVHSTLEKHFMFSSELFIWEKLIKNIDILIIVHFEIISISYIVHSWYNKIVKQSAFCCSS